MNIPPVQFANRAWLKKNSREWNFYTEREKKEQALLRPYKRLQEAMKAWK